MAHAAAKAFPLSWPPGRPRTKYREVSRFGDRTLAKSLQALKTELDRLRAGYITISTNVPLKANGDPYSDPGRMPDPGVAVYFRLNGAQYALCCDRWIAVEDNLYAVAKHIEAMRGMERWGVACTEQTFAGFKEIAAAAEDAWWQVLCVPETATREQIEASYRALARQAHPDVAGGSTAWMQKLNVARDQALKARGA